MIKGIDVSKYQGAIDWHKVKADGVQFAMLRAGYGKADAQKDPCFESYYAGATAVGLPVGAYHYSYAKTVEDAKREADTFLRWLSGKRFDYPVALDIEDKSQAQLGKALISDIIRAFCERVKAEGYYVCVYANKDWLTNRIDEDCKKRYDIWLAQWTSAPTYTGAYGMWQYTSDGKVNGIAGRVDRNLSYKDYPALMRANGWNGVPKSEQPKKSLEQLVAEVRAGKYGDGEARKKALAAEGYDYETVRAAVNAAIAAEKGGASKPTAPKPATPAQPKPTPNPAPSKPAPLAKGQPVQLKDAPLYVSSTADKPARRISGTYYLYDGKLFGTRCRITALKSMVGKLPAAQNVTGYVEKAFLKS